VSSCSSTKGKLSVRTGGSIQSAQSVQSVPSSRSKMSSNIAKRDVNQSQGDMGQRLQRYSGATGRASSSDKNNSPLVPLHTQFHAHGRDGIFLTESKYKDQYSLRPRGLVPLAI
jgi:hypothetical protein